MKKEYQMPGLRQDRLLRLTQVLKIVPVSKTTIWAWVKQEKFPKPFKLSPRCTVWKENDVLEFVRELNNEAR